MTDQATTARQNLLRMAATVSCPRCKVAAGESCQWGTSSGSPIHVVRITRALLAK